MNLAVRDGGAWRKLGAGAMINGVWFVASTIEGMSDEEREAVGSYDGGPLMIASYQPAGPRPKGQRLVSSSIADFGSGLVEKAVYEPIPIGERKAVMLAAIDAERDRRQQLDVVYDFGEIDAVSDAGQSAPAGEKALKMRFEPDQRNWLGLQSQALAAVISGQGDMVMPMRAEDNWNIQTTAMQVLGATAALFARNAAILFHGGALKTQVRTAAGGSALDAIDILVGWP